jgi:hypothetical protein
MTNQNSNPFVLPGMGQASADMAGNPLLASMEMMRQAWAGLTGPGGLAQALPMAPPMNPEELERRIAELRTVESWLRMNLSMLTSAIQGMEVQRSTIATLRSFVDNLGSHAADPSSWGDASPLEVALGLKPARGQAKPAQSDSAQGGQRGPDTAPAANTAAPREKAGGTQEGPDASSAGSPQAISQAAQSASEAWWGMLQQQFNQLAAATAATMPPGGQPDQGATTPKGGAAPGQAAASGRTAKAASPTPAAAKDSTPRGSSSASRKTAPRKTAARKNKIQSGPDRS